MLLPKRQEIDINRKNAEEQSPQAANLYQLFLLYRVRVILYQDLHPLVPTIFIFLERFTHRETKRTSLQLFLVQLCYEKTKQKCYHNCKLNIRMIIKIQFKAKVFL